MAITERDEYPHAPEAHDRWQENFFIIAWSVGADLGFLMHCKRWPSTGAQTARIVAVIGDRVVSRRVVEPIPPDGLSVGGLRLEIPEPLRRLRLRGGFHGTDGFGPLGFVAWRGDGRTPVELDLSLTSNLIPADFSHGFELLAQALARDTPESKPFEHTQEHYEQGGRCEGYIVIDGERRRIEGLFVRDHTWGRRNEAAMSASGHGFWTATALDEGELFLNATGMTTLHGTHGVGVVVDKNGQTTTTDVAVHFEPKGGLLSFDRTRVVLGGPRPIEVHGRAAIHLVKYLPGSGPRRFDDNAISRVDCAGMQGFGVHEYAGTLTEEQAKIMEAAEA